MAQSSGGPVPLSQLAVQQTWDGVVYGPPGCGKSCTATITGANSFVFDVDCSMGAAAARRVKIGARMDNQIVWNVQTTRDFDAAMTWLKANMRMFLGGVVVLDSATELQRIVNREVVGQRKRLAPEQREWGEIRLMMEALIVEFRYMPVNFVMTAHEFSKYDPDYQREVARPSFDGRIAFEYAKHFSWIARLVARPVVTGANPDGTQAVGMARALCFGPSPYYHFKDRSGAMREYEEPSLDPLLERMRQSANPAAGQAAV